MISELFKKQTVSYHEFVEVTDAIFNQLSDVIPNPQQWLITQFNKHSRRLLTDDECALMLVKLQQLLTENPPILTVANGYQTGWIGQGKIYIGRANANLNLKANPLANPFPISDNCTREQSIAKYRQWLFQKIKENDSQVMAQLNILKLIIMKKIPTQLVCYCHPKPCHGEVIIKAVKWLLKTV